MIKTKEFTELKSYRFFAPFVAKSASVWTCSPLANQIHFGDISGGLRLAANPST
jgi:hypothetical protein